MSLVSLVVAVAFMLLIQIVETKAAWGDFDTSFGFQGVAGDTVTGHHPRSIAIQPDGKILVTGYKDTIFGDSGFFLRRYLSNGQLDTAFGNNGAAIIPGILHGSGNYEGRKMLVQSNGKITVAGTANGYYAVWQFNSNGRNDLTFGQSGLQVLTSYPVVSYLYETPVINIQSGKILLGIPKERENRIILLRLNSNGTNDNSFGNLGESLTTMVFFGGFGVIVESNGKITVGGTINANLTYPPRGLERKLANGQIDLSFFPTYFYPNHAGQTRPGLVKLATREYVMRVAEMAVLAPELDKFSSSGDFVSTLEFPAIAADCPSVFTNQNDGKLLVNVGEQGTLFRFNANLDAGTMETYNCSNISGISYPKAAIQTDDKMIVVGRVNNNLMLARVLLN